MALVTPDEAVVANVKAALKAHSVRLRQSVGRILSKRAQNRATLSASGTFVRFRGRDYFLTAAHALVDKGDDALLTATSTAGISIREVVHSYTKQPNSSEDVLDVGLFVITDEMKRVLGPITPIEIDKTIRRTPYAPGHGFVVVGYPRSKNKKPLLNSPLPGNYQGLLVTGLRHSQHIGHHPAVGPRSHIVLGWSGESYQDIDSKDIVTGSLKGISGGPIFDLGNHSDIDVLAGVDQPLPTLAGVFTRHIASEKALLGTRLDAIIQVLDREAMWPK